MPRKELYVQKVGCGGRITIPPEYAAHLGLNVGTFAAIEVTDDGRIVVYPVDFVPRK